MRYYYEWDGDAYSVIDRRAPSSPTGAPMAVARTASRDIAEVLVDALNARNARRRRSTLVGEGNEEVPESPATCVGGYTLDSRA